MRIAVISDIHANAEALQAVFDDMSTLAPDQIICLGDIVGYNTQVHDTLALLRDQVIPGVYGNHELMVLGLLPADSCGPRAARAVQWTRNEITAAERDYLSRLPSSVTLCHELLFMHSTLGDPVRRLERPEQYVKELRTIRHHAPEVRLCCTGHTHVPGVVEIAPDGCAKLRLQETVFLRPDCAYFINPGSVGYPRGDDTRATYALYEGARRRVTMRRVPYNAAAVMRENARHRVDVELGTGQAPLAPTGTARVAAMVHRLTGLAR